MKASKLIKEFKQHKLGPFIEVPCSLLAPLITELMQDHECEVINPANEAIAMGMAAGSFLATNRIPLVLIQNSGLCNTLNALTSLNLIYKIPLLYLISWRGRPGVKDTPQHSFMGTRLEKIMKTFNIPYEILKEETYKTQIRTIINRIRSSKRPAALLLERGLMEKEINKIEAKSVKSAISRNDAIATIMRVCNSKACYVTTNGYISREALHISSINGLEKRNPSFYMLGSMGHALPIALGIAKYIKKNKKVVVIDGDGGCLMHLGAMASIGKGKRAAINLIHIVLDNGVYASVGNQPTVSGDIDFVKIAYGCGYRNVHSIKKASSLRRILSRLLQYKGPSFLHVLINNKEQLPKPRVSNKYSCEEIKKTFVDLIR